MEVKQVTLHTDHEEQGQQLAEYCSQGQLNHVNGAKNKVRDLVADPFNEEHHGARDPQLEKLAPTLQ